MCRISAFDLITDSMGNTNGKCKLTLTPINKQMELSSLENQIQKTFPIPLLHLILQILLNAPIKNIYELYFKTEFQYSCRLKN